MSAEQPALSHEHSAMCDEVDESLDVDDYDHRKSSESFGCMVNIQG